MAKLYCPYCGSKKYHPFEDRYECDDCGWLFDEDDIRYENLRHEISRYLIDTDEENPLCLAGGPGDIYSVFQVPGDGTIWYHMFGEYDASDPTGLLWNELDTLDADELESLLAKIKDSI